MYSFPEQIISANRASIETFTVVANVAFSGVERVVALNVSTARSFLEEGSSTSRSWLAAKDVQDMVAIQSTVAEPDLDKLGAYARRAYDIVTNTQETISRMANARLSEINLRFDQEMEKMGKNAPVGTDLAMTALRSALSMANSTFQDMTKATKQFTDLAEASIALTAANTHVRKAA